MSRVSLERRHAIILELYSQFHDPKYLEWDPLSLVRTFLGNPRAEYVALVSALMAFGGVKQINASIREILGRLEIFPEQIGSWTPSEAELLKALHGFSHRIYVGEDLAALTLLYLRSVRTYGSLEQHFCAHHPSDATTVVPGLSGVIRDYRAWAEDLRQKGAHFKHLLNSPEDGSTCKRWLMLLKWLIRPNDGIDLGLWKKNAQLRPSQLLIPLDTHLFRISRSLGMTRLKSANLKAAHEVTRALKRLDPEDPVRFDFSLCRHGMFQYRGLVDRPRA